MAQFQNENIRLSLTISIGTNENLTKSDETINDINQSLAHKLGRKMSIDNINASRPRINSFPVPPLPRDETPINSIQSSKTIKLFRNIMNLARAKSTFDSLIMREVS